MIKYVSKDCNGIPHNHENNVQSFPCKTNNNKYLWSGMIKYVSKDCNGISHNHENMVRYDQVCA